MPVVSSTKWILVRVGFNVYSVINVLAFLAKFTEWFYILNPSFEWYYEMESKLHSKHIYIEKLV